MIDVRPYICFACSFAVLGFLSSLFNKLNREMKDLKNILFSGISLSRWFLILGFAAVLFQGYSVFSMFVCEWFGFFPRALMALAALNFVASVFLVSGVWHYYKDVDQLIDP